MTELDFEVLYKWVSKTMKAVSEHLLKFRC